MRRGRKGSRKLFAIIIGGIIIAILVAITVFLYTGYVERARVTEAAETMGPIITSQKVEKHRTGKYYSASTIEEFKSRGIDISDTKFFTYTTAPMAKGGFMVIATTTDAFGVAGEWMAYIYDPVRGGRWESSAGPLILDDRFLLQS